MIWFLSLHLPDHKKADDQWQQAGDRQTCGLNGYGNNRIPMTLLGNLLTFLFQLITACIHNCLLLVEL